MGKPKIMGIVVIVLCGFIALSYAGGFYFYAQYTKEMEYLNSQDLAMRNNIVELNKELKGFSASLDKVNSNFAGYLRNISILESRVTMSETVRKDILSKMSVSERERRDILAKLNVIGNEIHNLQETYANYTTKLNEMEEVLNSNKSFIQEDTSTAAAGGEFVDEVDLGEIAVENMDQ